MAYAYAKNIKSLKRRLRKKGYIIEDIGRTSSRFNLNRERKYYFHIKKRIKK